MGARFRLRRACSAAFLFALIVPLFAAAAQDEAPLYTADDLSGWELRPAEWYNGKSLYGYIDGGAVLYQEYGFEALAVQTAEHEGRALTIEWFRMASPEAAFGVFSLARRFAERDSTLPAWACRAAGRWTLHRGPYAVTITPPEGEPDAAATAARLIGLVEGAIPREHCPPPAPLLSPALSACAQRIVLVRGPAGANVGAADYADALEAAQPSRLWLAFCDAGRVVGVLLADDAGPLDAFAERLGLPATREARQWATSVAAGARRAACRLSDTTLLFIDARPDDAGFERLLHALQVGAE
jgi:hypothetical protein